MMKREKRKGIKMKVYTEGIKAKEKEEIKQISRRKLKVRRKSKTQYK